MKRFFFAIVVVTALASISSACPLCKDSIPNSDALQASSLPGGFNYSIYSMFVGFFGTLGFAVFTITRGVRDSNRQMQSNHEVHKDTK